MKSIDTSTAKMYKWLKTWENEEGAFNGWVVHRYDLKRLKYIHDTPWAQASIINAFINLYNTTKDQKFYSDAEKAVRLQISRLDSNTGMFNNAGFEDDRFSSLVHNSLADCAILNFYNCCNNDELKKQILQCVKVNINKYFIEDLWNDQVGAFKFSHIDYYSTEKDRFVANMNSIAVEAMIKYYKIVKDVSILKYINRIGKFLSNQINFSNCIITNGAIPYSSEINDYYINIYTALTLRGINQLYLFSNNSIYKKIAITASQQLYSYSDGKFFYHAIVHNQEEKYPLFIAGSGMILNALYDCNKLYNLNYNLTSFIKNVLSYQHPIGGVQSFKYYNSKDNHRKKFNDKTEVWEDVAPGVPWNAHLFEFLSKIVSNEIISEINHVKIKRTLKIKYNYLYYEGVNRFIIISIYPLRSFNIIYIKKSNNISKISFSLKEIYKKLRK